MRLCPCDPPFQALASPTAVVALRAAALLGVVVFGYVLPAAAQSQVSRDTMRVTLNAARRLAVEANPNLLASSLERSIAAGRLQQARTIRFNPSGEVLAPAGGNGLELGLSQELEVFGQRHVRARAANAGLSLATALVSNSRRITVGEVDRTFYRLVFRKQRTLLAESILDLNKRVAAIAERQLSAGEISRLDYNLAVIELGRSRSRALIARRERDEIALDFALLLGVGPGVVVDPVLDPSQHAPSMEADTLPSGDARALVQAGERLSPDSLVAIALTHRTDLAARAALIEQSRAELGLARREAMPNVIARVVGEPNGESSGRVIRGGVGLSIPVFNRNRGEIASRRAVLQQAEIQRAGLKARVKTEVNQAIAAYRAAAAEVDILETTVLPPARQNRRLLETAYREGKVGLPVLLLIRNQVIDAELDYWSAWLAEREALATLAEITGQNLSGLPETEAIR